MFWLRNFSCYRSLSVFKQRSSVCSWSQDEINLSAFVDQQVDSWWWSYRKIEKQGVCEKIQRKDPCWPRKVPRLEGKGTLEVFMSLQFTLAIADGLIKDDWKLDMGNIRKKYRNNRGRQEGQLCSVGFPAMDGCDITRSDFPVMSQSESWCHLCECVRLFVFPFNFFRYWVRKLISIVTILQCIVKVYIIQIPAKGLTEITWSCP